MKLGPVTKINERNKTRSEKLNDDVIPANCDVIVICPIYYQFGAIQIPDSGSIVCKTYLFINSIFLSCKNGKQN